jgi:hypothetical protein
VFYENQKITLCNESENGSKTKNFVYFVVALALGYTVGYFHDKLPDANKAVPGIGAAKASMDVSSKVCPSKKEFGINIAGYNLNIKKT